MPDQTVQAVVRKGQGQKEQKAEEADRNDVFLPGKPGHAKSGSKQRSAQGADITAFEATGPEP